MERELMIYTLTDKRVTIHLPDSVDTRNVGTVEKELFDILEQVEFDDIILDCSGLKFITSSGLRTLLKVQKKYPKIPPIKLRNVSEEVNGVLSMTGLADVFEVTKRIKIIDVSGFSYSSTGINGEIYRGDHDLMVKMYRKEVDIDDVEEERRMAKMALRAGVPTAISYLIVQDKSGRYGIFFEDIKGNSLVNIIKNKPETLPVVAERFADFVRELHNTDVSDSGLENIKNRYLNWLLIAEKKDPSIDKARFRSMIERMSDRTTFIHGNLNLGNVFFTDDDFILMDMSSCGYGHPVFDLQSIYGSLVAIEIDNPGYCERMFGLTAVQCRTFWNYFIKKYLNTDTGSGYDGTVSERDDKVVLVNESKLNLLLEEYYILKEQLIDVL